FPGPDIMDYLIQHTSTPAPSARALEPDVPPALEALIASALAKEPAARPASAGAFRKALQEIRKGLAPADTSRPPPPATTGPAAPSLGSGGGASIEPGTVLNGRYRLRSVLGEGGM